MGNAFSDKGFVLLRSLLTMWAILLCAAALSAALAAALKQPVFMNARIEKEMIYRNERIMRRLQ
jgi:hypothetical protein